MCAFYGCQKDDAMNIYLIRHGETNWNIEWRLQGQTDVPLNETGLQQAKEAAKRLKEIPFDGIYSSPLQRAKDTACTIASLHQEVVVQTDERLKEFGFGAHEGTTPENDPDKEDRRILFKTPEKYVPKGDAESYDDLKNRAESFLNDLVKTGKENVLVVAHGALCKGLIWVMLQSKLEDFWKMPLMQNCKELKIKWQEGRFQLPAEFEAFRPSNVCN